MQIIIIRKMEQHLKNASSYQADTSKHGWRCTVCGFILEADELPEDFICPVCKQPASVFEKI